MFYVILFFLQYKWHIGCSPTRHHCCLTLLGIVNGKYHWIKMKLKAFPWNINSYFGGLVLWKNQQDLTTVCKLFSWCSNLTKTKGGLFTLRFCGKWLTNIRLTGSKRNKKNCEWCADYTRSQFLTHSVSSSEVKLIKTENCMFFFTPQSPWGLHCAFVLYLYIVVTEDK